MQVELVTTARHISRSGIRILALIVLGVSVFPGSVSRVEAAVQIGGHMDFVLNNGITVRVFPEAVDQSRINPGSILPSRQRVNTKPAGGDPCLKLKAEWDKRTGGKPPKPRPKPKPVNPSWIKKTAALKSYLFVRAHYATQKPTSWYYLPSEPRVAIKNNIPEATFVKFITDETTEAGGAEGGLFHLMVTYGLTQSEEAELKDLLAEAVPGAVLKGMVDLEPSKSTENFIVTSGTLSDEGFAPKGVLTSGWAPSFPGGKAAVAGRLSSLGAQLMEATFENPTSDLSVTFAYDYVVKTQAYKAEVRIDMDRVQEVSDCALQTYDKTKTRTTSFNAKGAILGALVGGPIGSLFSGLRTETKTRISEKDLQEVYDQMISLGAITVKIDQNLPDADTSAIESSMMQMAMESFTSMQKAVSTNQELAARKASNQSDVDKKVLEERERNRRSADNYEVFTLKRKQTRMTGVQTLKIEKGIALYRTHSMTGNMGAIIREYKDDVFDEVLLNDPFFKRGAITVDLDVETSELMANNMINNASVEVVVPFSGSPYRNSSIFTREDISSGVVMKQFTFATRGEERANKSCPFKYIASWSLAGGGKWPAKPTPECASEMSITLVPPIKARRIDVEADLGEMEELGVRGAEVLLRHTRYGRVETESAKFRLAKGEPYLETTLYVDKDTPEVDFKIVLTHKSKGKFSTDWQSLEDDFVYANLSGLPLTVLEEMQQKIPEIEAIIEDLQGENEG